MKAFRFACTVSLITAVVFLSSCHRKTVPASSNVPTSGSSKPANGNAQVDVSNMENDILFYINKYRRSKGLTELQMLSVASGEAAKHSANMAARRVAFGHTGFESRVSAIARSLGSVSAAAENVADGTLTAKQVVDGWLHSTGHKKNIEGKYTLTGIGVAKDPGGVIFFTQIFVRK